MNKLDLEQQLSLPVIENENLSNHTNFKVGGPAKYFVKVENVPQLFTAINVAKKNNLPFFVIGGGSNILVSDNGFDGLVIKTVPGKMEITGEKIKVFAGNILNLTIREAIANKLSGLEFAGNIPGTVGGAIYGNAGAYGQGAGDLVESIEVIDLQNEPSLKIFSKEACQFAYRDSIFKKNKNLIVAGVIFKLTHDENSEEKIKVIDVEWQKRVCSQPLNLPSCGCWFKNILASNETKKYESWSSNGKISAAKFIDEAGLKGFKIGGAGVSDVHANFIVNLGAAKAEDVLQLVSVVKTKVRNEFGVQLEEEVQYVGF
ncbi:MAG: UDP-N-acetylmuramate dehydrogenase [Patescibacteria group bacterium]